MNGYSNNELPHPWWETHQWSTDRTTVIANPGQVIWNGPPSGQVVAKSLDAFETHELVMELIARGYAVAKMGADELAEEVAK